MPNSVSIANKKANFLFEIVKKFQAGLILTGSEVKSVKFGRASISEAFCYFRKDQLLVKSMNIAIYEPATYNNHEPTRIRQLLLKKSEITTLQNKVKERGLTIVPLVLYVNERGLVKLDIALAKGKKVFDKRESIKNRDQKRSLDRDMKRRT